MLVYRPRSNVAAFNPEKWKGSRRPLGTHRPAAPDAGSEGAAPADLRIRGPKAEADKFHQYRVIARARRMKGIRGGMDHRRFWFTLLRRTPEVAEAHILELLKRYRPQQLYIRLFIPTLTLSGTMFALGRITYHDEHYITNACLRLMRLVRRHIVPLPSNGLTALATGVGQDSHRIGLRMVCDLLHAAGWNTHFLDTNERGTLRDALHTLRPDALLLSIGYPQEFEHARRMVAEARRQGFTGIIAVGGRAVATTPNAVELLGADLTAANGLDLARKLTHWTRDRRAAQAEERRKQGTDDPHGDMAEEQVA